MDDEKYIVVVVDMHRALSYRGVKVQQYIDCPNCSTIAVRQPVYFKHTTDYCTIMCYECKTEFRIECE